MGELRKNGKKKKNCKKLSNMPHHHIQPGQNLQGGKVASHNLGLNASDITLKSSEVHLGKQIIITTVINSSPSKLCLTLY